MKKLIMDLDDTITRTTNGDYANSKPIESVIEKLREYQALGFQIVISTARNMRTHKNNIGKINIHTLPNIISWLDKHKVPYDEIIVGKPWCGFEGFYVDDKAIRPSEFVNNSYDEIIELINNEKELTK
tara:strand:+ start:19445 stop:19828 length:384 start_codon:yes stop_codon:yes gene_type:complete